MYLQKGTDCLCGYATGKTDSCGQIDCPTYFAREAKMAKMELHEKINNATEEFMKRVNESLKNRRG